MIFPTHRHIIVSRTRAIGGAKSGWHHHGARHLYGFQLAGQMRLEYGPRRIDGVVVRRGDFFHIPPRLVHRDVNPDKDREFVVVNILVGGGEPVINVEDPQAGTVVGRKKRSVKRRLLRKRS